MTVDVALLPHVGDVLAALTLEENWTVVGDSVADIIAECKAYIEEWYA